MNPNIPSWKTAFRKSISRLFLLPPFGIRKGFGKISDSDMFCYIYNGKRKRARQCQLFGFYLAQIN